MRTIKQGSAPTVVFLMVSSADHVSPATGLSPVVTISKNGTTGATAANSPATQVDAANAPGWYKIALTSAETNVAGDLIIHATGTDADPADRLLTVESSVVGDVPSLVWGYSTDLRTVSLGRKSLADIVGAMATYPTVFVAANTNLENRLIFSFLFGTGWIKDASAYVTNRLPGDPFGKEFAAKLCETATTGTFSMYQDTPLPYGTIYTISLYAKAAERSWVYLKFGANPANAGVWFNLANGTVGTAQASALSYGIESAGNGWYRCWATATTLYGSGVCQVGVSTGDGVDTYAGVAGSGVMIHGAQLQVGTVASFYRPTADSSIITDGVYEATTQSLATMATALVATIPGAVWSVLTSAVTTASSIGKLLVDNINATISSRSTYAGGDTPGTTTLLSRIASALTITGGKVDVNDKSGFSLAASQTCNITGNLSGSVGSVTGNVGGSVASVTAGVTLATSQPNYAPAKAGDAMALTSGERTTLSGAIWNTLTSALTTAGSIGKLLVDNINATISSRSTYAGGDTPGTATLLTRISQALSFTAGKVDANASVSLPQANIDAIAAGVASQLSGQGSGNTLVNHDTGGIDNFRCVTTDGTGIDGVQISAYLTTAWNNGNPSSGSLLATTETGPDGRWKQPIYLDTGYSYTLVFAKQGNFNLMTRSLTV